MLLNLTDLSNESLQSQISRQIRAKILAGELPADTSIPSIRVLARDNRVSVITVQRAYENLMRENLIHSRRGKGFFVSELKQDKKTNMAKERLLENIKPPIRASLEEGLKDKDVLDIVGSILKSSG